MKNNKIKNIMSLTILAVATIVAMFNLTIANNKVAYNNIEGNNNTFLAEGKKEEGCTTNCKTTTEKTTKDTKTIKREYEIVVKKPKKDEPKEEPKQPEQPKVEEKEIKVQQPKSEVKPSAIPHAGAEVLPITGSIVFTLVSGAAYIINAKKMK